MLISKNKILLVSLLFLMACEERKQLREMHDSTGQMNKTTQSMDKTMQEMNATMKGMNDTMRGMNQTMVGMNETMQGMHGTMSGMDQKMGNMSNTMNGMNGTMQSMNGTMGEMNGTMQGMDSKMGDMSETMHGMNDTMGGMNSTMSGMDKKMGKMSSTMTGMNETMGGMSTTMENMNTKLGGMDKKMGALVSKIDAMDGKMGNLVDQITNMDSKMGSLLSCIGSMDDKMASLVTQIVSMDGKMGNLVTKIDAMDGKMGNLVQQITGMNTTLQELGTDMKSMSGKLDGMSAKMGDLLGKMNEIYDVARPGMAMMLRGQALQEMEKADGLPGKVSAAAKYYMADEYQVFQGTGKENDEKRLKLINSAVSEFILDLKNHLKDGKKEDQALSLTGANEDVEALSLAMHRINEIQEEFVAANKDKGYQQVNMFNLIGEALQYSQAIAKGQADFKSAPDYIKSLLAEKDLLVWLLKIRLNSLIKMTLGRISPLKDSPTKTAAFWWLFKPLDIFGGPDENSPTSDFVKWQLETNKENLPLLQKVNKYMELAVETKGLLESLGYESKLPGFLYVGIKNLDTSNIDSITDSQVKEVALQIASYRGQLLGKVDQHKLKLEFSILDRASTNEAQAPTPKPDQAGGLNTPASKQGEAAASQEDQTAVVPVVEESAASVKEPGKQPEESPKGERVPENKAQANPKVPDDKHPKQTPKADLKAEDAPQGTSGQVVQEVPDRAGDDE